MDYRNERVGLPLAARYLGISMSELRNAVQDGTLLFGVPAPEVWFIAGPNNRTWYFRLGEVMDAAEAIQNARRKTS